MEKAVRPRPGVLGKAGGLEALGNPGTHWKLFLRGPPTPAPDPGLAPTGSSSCGAADPCPGPWPGTHWKLFLRGRRPLPWTLAWQLRPPCAGSACLVHRSLGLSGLRTLCANVSGRQAAQCRPDHHCQIPPRVGHLGRASPAPFKRQGLRRSWPGC